MEFLLSFSELREPKSGQRLVTAVSPDLMSHCVVSDNFLLKCRRVWRILTADLDDAVSSYVIIRVRRIWTEGAAGGSWGAVCDAPLLLLLLFLLKLCHNDRKKPHEKSGEI